MACSGLRLRCFRWRATPAAEVGGSSWTLTSRTSASATNVSRGLAAVPGRFSGTPPGPQFAKDLLSVAERVGQRVSLDDDNGELPAGSADDTCWVAALNISSSTRSLG